MVVNLVPLLLLCWSGRPIIPPELTIVHFAGLFLIVGGASIAIACILRFASEVRGTLAPLDPTGGDHH